MWSYIHQCYQQTLFLSWKNTFTLFFVSIEHSAVEKVFDPLYIYFYLSKNVRITSYLL